VSNPSPPQPLAAEPAPEGDASRAELYRIAQRLDIAGRSKMTRDELAAAVGAAGEPPA
jgi:hypothetical protein